MINLEELDQLGEILGNISIPVGTYSGATLTVAGNQGDVAGGTPGDDGSHALPIGAVATEYASGSFTMNVAGGTTPATIDVSTASGSASLVYQVDRTAGVVTVSSIDVTASAGWASMITGAMGGPDAGFTAGTVTACRPLALQ